MTWWVDLTATIWRLLDEHGQLVAFVLLFLEESGVPPIIPGDLLMVLVGVRAAEGRLRLLEALAVLELATVLGGTVLYWVSAWAGHPLAYRLGGYVDASPQRLDAAAAALRRRGARAIVLGRLVPGFCIFTAVAAGVLGFPYRYFAPALALGGFVHLLAFVMLGYVFGPPVLAVAASLHLPAELLASAAILIALGVWTVRAARGRTAEPTVPQSMLDRLWAGLLAGLLGAVESTLLANVLITALGLISYREPAEALRASGLLGRVTAPSLLITLSPSFLILPTLWGAVYGLGPAKALPGPSWLRGAVFALLPLAFSLLVVLPAAGAGPLGLKLEIGAIPALGDLLRHLAYGAVLGVTYSSLARHPAPEGDPAGVRPA